MTRKSRRATAIEASGEGASPLGQGVAEDHL
jgi:hypothetical protein